MKIDKINEQLGCNLVVAINRDELASLLEKAETEREDDTGIAGLIRTLRFGSYVLVQERTPEGDYIVRKLPSAQAAKRFVEARLSAYERMWDG